MIKLNTTIDRVVASAEHPPILTISGDDAHITETARDAVKMSATALQEDSVPHIEELQQNGIRIGPIRILTEAGMQSYRQLEVVVDNHYAGYERAKNMVKRGNLCHDHS